MVIITRKDLNEPMEGVQIRIPKELRAKAKALVGENKTGSKRITETDIYRTAIILYLSNCSTESRENESVAEEEA
jgi:hypothetical protein